jgi:sulfur carrier protein ThiS
VRVEVRAFATLAAFVPSRSRDGAAFLDLPDDGTVRDLVRALGVPDEMAVVALVNGAVAEIDRPLESEDIVTLFPPLVGG